MVERAAALPRAHRAYHAAERCGAGGRRRRAVGDELAAARAAPPSGRPARRWARLDSPTPARPSATGPAVRPRPDADPSLVLRPRSRTGAVVPTAVRPRHRGWRRPRPSPSGATVELRRAGPRCWVELAPAEDGSCGLPRWWSTLATRPAPTSNLARMAVPCAGPGGRARSLATPCRSATDPHLPRPRHRLTMTDRGRTFDVMHDGHETVAHLDHPPRWSPLDGARSPWTPTRVTLQR